MFNKISRFIEEIPKEMLEGSEVINKNQSETRETTYEWEYGAVKKYQTKAFNDKFSPKEPVFSFRTAESFLNTIKQTNANESGVDLSQYRTGITVYHKKFGEGIINQIEQEGDDLKLDIHFEKVGHKRLMAKYANLEII